MCDLESLDIQKFQISDFLCTERHKNAKEREFCLRNLEFNKSVGFCRESEDNAVKLLAQRKQNLLVHEKKQYAWE